jgi:hypothetical protein
MSRERKSFFGQRSRWIFRAHSTGIGRPVGRSTSQRWATSTRLARQPATRAEASDEVRPGQFSLTLGYTASYRPREDSVPDSVSVVAVQSSRGPE